MTDHRHDDAADRSPRQFWERRYRDEQRVWSGRPNPAVVEAVSPLSPGTALDLACGEGADAIWLAGLGWTVTGVDIAPTAVDRARRAAEDRGLGAVARFVAADLTKWEPEGPYDLVTASFLHSPVEVPRTAILRRAAEHIRVGGHLLVVSHAAPPPWSGLARQPGHRFPGPEQEFADLELGPAWRIVTARTSSRPATGPSGESAELLDGVLLAQRR
ncbi:class I SAM-dependent methyltransferase [Tersicoccus sp. MR15.9]|uniref:class I SAM-dependent methyltransferase n=1 Tax=Tersicoccus mangrovi TaxID=3121635 RepID=UPI002FE5AACA